MQLTAIEVEILSVENRGKKKGGGGCMKLKQRWKCALWCSKNMLPGKLAAALRSCRTLLPPLRSQQQTHPEVLEAPLLLPMLLELAQQETPMVPSLMSLYTTKRRCHRHSRRCPHRRGSLSDREMRKKKVAKIRMPLLAAVVIGCLHSSTSLQLLKRLLQPQLPEPTLLLQRPPKLLQPRLKPAPKRQSARRGMPRRPRLGQRGHAQRQLEQLPRRPRQKRPQRW